MYVRFRGFAGSFCVFVCALFAASACGSDPAMAVDVTLSPQDGPYDGTLTIEPNPPQVGLHHVVLTLDTDPESGEPLEGATVRLSPWMPAHGHGSKDVDAVERAPGVYVAQDVWLNMPGIWDLRVYVEAHSEQGDLIATVEVP